MKFGDIFLILLVLLILYYAVVITMDLYKAKLEKDAEKEKDPEEEIDISDEASSFQPIYVSREETKKTVENSEPESKVDTDSEPKPAADAKPEKENDKSGTSEAANATEKAADADKGPASDKESTTDKDSEKPEKKENPYDPNKWRIPDDVISEYQHRPKGNRPTLKPEKTDKFQQPDRSPKKAETEPEQSAPIVQNLREPIMEGGMPVDQLHLIATEAATAGTTDLLNIVAKCEST